MSSLPGLFDSFDNLDQIDVGSLIPWIKNPPNPIQLENYLANRILYPQTMPLNEADIKIDLAILREVLRLNGPKKNQNGEMLGENPFLNITLRQIIIPDKFLQYVPNLTELTWAFVDGLLLSRAKEDFFGDLWTVIVSDHVDEIVGSILLPQFGSSSDVMDLNILGKGYKIKAGSLTLIPCPKDRCELSYKFSNGKFLGKEENAIEISGGKLGIMIDGRLS